MERVLESRSGLRPVDPPYCAIATSPLPVSFDAQRDEAAVFSNRGDDSYRTRDRVCMEFFFDPHIQNTLTAPYSRSQLCIEPLNSGVLKQELQAALQTN